MSVRLCHVASVCVCAFQAGLTPACRPRVTEEKYLYSKFESRGNSLLAVKTDACRGMQRIRRNPGFLHFRRWLANLFAALMLLIALFSLIRLGAPTRRIHSPVALLPSGLLTPYALTPGGGERYLLQTLLNFQQLGHETHLLMDKNAVCSRLSCVLQTADMLGIPVNAKRLTLIPTELRNLHERPVKPRFHIFFLLGNEKFPQFPGLGSMNIYMCQFPFDLERYEGPESWSMLATYDFVFFNSQYSYNWYNTVLLPYLPLFQAQHVVLPKMEVVYPPVPVEAEFKDGPERLHIAVLGRVFEGRQSTGHDIALELFERISPSVPAGTKLFLIGNVQPGHSEYAQRLRRRATEKNLNVEFLFSVSALEVKAALAQTKVFWHLTGVLIGELVDPASIEHFGISIVEAMSFGCIPIVTLRGGPMEIVQHGITGFHASGVMGFVDYTLQVFKFRFNEQRKMSLDCFERAKVFSEASFDQKLKFLLHRGMVTLPFRRFVLNHIANESTFSATLPSVSDWAAVIVEPGLAFAFEFCVKNVMRHLGSRWSLIVFHTFSNEPYVRTSLRSLSNVTFITLPAFTQISEYNEYLKSTAFWDAIPAQKALIFQTDSVMLKSNIDAFLHYDYVGAPWHTDNERWAEMLALGITEGVGNGGFSLRSVPLMRKIAKEAGSLSPYTEQEDVFYVSRALQRGYSVAGRRAAYAFCLEVPCTDIAHRPDPMALHAAWYYNSNDVVMPLLDRTLT